MTDSAHETERDTDDHDAAESNADSALKTNLLVAPTDRTVLVENDRTGAAQEATADDNGILRDATGRAFNAGAYSIIAEDRGGLDAE